jgi:hypothetical protein
MFLTSPFQPLPPSTPPADLNLTFLSFISSVTISAMVLTLALSGNSTCAVVSWVFYWLSWLKVDVPQRIFMVYLLARFMPWLIAS